MVHYSRSFLSASIWVPVAVLSYASYLFHMVFSFSLYAHFSLPKLEEGKSHETCPWAAKEVAYNFSMLVGLSLALGYICFIITYLLVEKPGIDARKAFWSVEDRRSKLVKKD